MLAGKIREDRLAADRAFARKPAALEHPDRRRVVDVAARVQSPQLRRGCDRDDGAQRLGRNGRRSVLLPVLILTLIAFPPLEAGADAPDSLKGPGGEKIEVERSYDGPIDVYRPCGFVRDTNDVYEFAYAWVSALRTLQNLEAQDGDKALPTRSRRDFFEYWDGSIGCDIEYLIPFRSSANQTIQALAKRLVEILAHSQEITRKNRDSFQKVDWDAYRDDKLALEKWKTLVLDVSSGFDSVESGMLQLKQLLESPGTGHRLLLAIDGHQKTELLDGPLHSICDRGIVASYGLGTETLVYKVACSFAEWLRNTPARGEKDD